MKFLKSAGKWILIIGGAALFGSWAQDLAFETRTNVFFGGLALAVAYVEASLKERIETLEYRLDEQSRRLNGYD